MWARLTRTEHLTECSEETENKYFFSFRCFRRWNLATDGNSEMRRQGQTWVRKKFKEQEICFARYFFILARRHPEVIPSAIWTYHEQSYFAPSSKELLFFFVLREIFQTCLMMSSSFRVRNKSSVLVRATLPLLSPPLPSGQIIQKVNANSWIAHYTNSSSCFSILLFSYLFLFANGFVNCFFAIYIDSFIIDIIPWVKAIWSSGPNLFLWVVWYRWHSFLVGIHLIRFWETSCHGRATLLWSFRCYT